MAEETLTPVSAAEPPKANPLSKPVSAQGGIKLPVKPMIRKPTVGAATPGAAVAVKPGLKLPPKPAVGGAITPGIKLPPKPMIRKPGAPGATAPSLPKPLPKPIVGGAPSAPSPAPAPAAPAPTPAVASDKPANVTSSLEQLKHVTQRLKSVTQPIPQQAILHKTGIISESGLSDLTDAQKQAAKSKTARISLSEAMGAAPVKNDAAPTKTIRIKRPGDLPLGGPASIAKKPAAPAGAPSAPAGATPAPAASGTTITQKKTLKVARPAGVVRPGAPKPAIKKPVTATTATTKPAMPAAKANGDIPDIADIPDIPDIPAKTSASGETDVPKAVGLASLIVQIAACGVAAALVKALYNSWLLPMVYGGCA